VLPSVITMSKIERRVIVSKGLAHTLQTVIIFVAFRPRMLKLPRQPAYGYGDTGHCSSPAPGRAGLVIIDRRVPILPRECKSLPSGWDMPSSGACVSGLSTTTARRALRFGPLTWLVRLLSTVRGSARSAVCHVSTLGSYPGLVVSVIAVR
jgi:hypothetical protein